MDRTRARITEAAIALHGSIGPAATTISAVAERAGVTRATLYRHFPNERGLARGLQCRMAQRQPGSRHRSVGGHPHPRDRLETALPALYRWYRSSEGMRANLLRDLAVLPPAIRAGIA